MELSFAVFLKPAIVRSDPLSSKVFAKSVNERKSSIAFVKIAVLPAIRSIMMSKRSSSKCVTPTELSLRSTNYEEDQFTVRLDKTDGDYFYFNLLQPSKD